MLRWFAFVCVDSGEERGRVVCTGFGNDGKGEGGDESGARSGTDRSDDGERESERPGSDQNDANPKEGVENASKAKRSGVTGKRRSERRHPPSEGIAAMRGPQSVACAIQACALPGGMEEDMGWGGWGGWEARGKVVVVVGMGQTTPQPRHKRKMSRLNTTLVSTKACGSCCTCHLISDAWSSS